MFHNVLDVPPQVVEVFSYPIHRDGLQLFEDQVPGRFGAEPPFGLHKSEQGVPSHVLRHCGDPGRHTQIRLCIFVSETTHTQISGTSRRILLPDVRHHGVLVEFGLGDIGRGQGTQRIISFWGGTVTQTREMKADEAPKMNFHSGGSGLHRGSGLK